MKCNEPGCQMSTEYEVVCTDQITGQRMKVGWCIIHAEENEYLAEKCMCGEAAVQVHDNNPVCEKHWNYAFQGIKRENRYKKDFSGNPSVLENSMEFSKYPEIENKGEPMTRFSVAVSLPKGKTEPNYGSNIGFFREATKREGGLVKTKTGGAVYRCALNLAKLRAMIEKYPEIKKKDGRSGEDIVWISMFELGDKKAPGVGF